MTYLKAVDTFEFEQGMVVLNVRKIVIRFGKKHIQMDKYDIQH